MRYWLERRRFVFPFNYCKKGVKLISKKYEKICNLLEDIDYTNWRKLSKEELINLLNAAQDKISTDDETKRKFIKAFIEVKKKLKITLH
jgi:CRISPR/Cas system CSM-associated protein Csm2 small subunit